MVHPDAAILRLAAVVESSDDAIFSEDAAGTIETWNPAAHGMFGFEPSQAIGASVEIIIPDSERPNARKLTKRVLEGERVNNFQTYRCRKDGTLVPVSLALSPIRDENDLIIGVATIARDISHQQLMEREAMRLAAIVDSSDDTIVSKDLNSIIQTWNKAAERMFGYPAEEAIGRSIRMIIPPERQQEEDEVLERIRRGDAISHFETERMRKDGSRVQISLTVSPIKDTTGRVIGASKIARDITAQVELVRKLGEANRIKDEFLAMLSHELRTPLNAVIGYTQMLRGGQIGDERRDQVLDIVDRNARLLSQLVSDMLDVSSIVTGKIRLKPSLVDVLQVARAAADVVRPAMEAKRLEFTLDSDGAPLIMNADADRLQQVFWNLLSNASKFTPEGGRVSMDLRRSGGSAEITVSDNGIGIPSEFLPHIFERFRQAEAGTRREYGGLGLGLSLVRHFVELHGGHVSAESGGRDKGSTFHVRLPLLADAPARD